MWSWGCATFGVLGNNKTIDTSSPVSVVGGFTDWCRLSTQNARFGAVRTNGTIWMWGSNVLGDLGDNSSTSTSSPVSVVGGFTDWRELCIGFTNSLGLRSNGTVWAWGQNGSGQIGDGTTTTRSSPVSVIGGFTGWCQVSAGGGHSAGIRTNGTAWTWGVALCGALGDNTLVNKSSPVSVVGGFTNWCQISAGSYSTAAIRSNGTLWAWGRNTVGRLGDNTTINKSSPVSVIGGFTDWCQVSAGVCHSAAVRTNGTVWTWGANGVGQLGDSTLVAKSSPVSVVGGFTDWCQVSSGTAQTFGIRTNGTIWSWGFNSSGRLGDGTVTDKSSPVSVVGGFTDWCNVAAGQFHAFGIRTNGTIWGWGSGGNGRLGDNTTTNKSSPVSVAGGFTDWCQVSGGNVHSAAIRKITVGF